MKNNQKKFGMAKQQGFTLWSFLFVAGVVLLAMYIGAKLVPVINADSAIKKALENTVESTALQDLRKQQIIWDIEKRLNIDGIYNPPKFEEVLSVTKTKEGTVVAIDYQENVPLFFNAGLYLDFAHQVTK